MKKTSFLIQSFFCLLGITPSALLATSCSCSNQPNYDEFTKTLYDSSYSEFIKYIENCPHISNQEIVVIDSDNDSLKEARKYLKDLVQQYGFNPITDEGGNIYYDIPASPGYENCKKIAIQAHMDMVWANAEGWSGEKGKVVSEEETINKKTFVHSKNNQTTLGADDGQGVGIILGITKTANDFNHGPIKCILTTDEDSTVYGAAHLDLAALDTDYLVNVDASTQDISIASAGTQGFRTKITDLQSYDIPDNYKLYSLKILGCKAGHSADAMVDGKGNPTNIAINILKKIKSENNSQILLQSIKDNGQTNVFASESEIVFVCSEAITGNDINRFFNEEKQTFFAEKDMSYVFNEVYTPTNKKAISNDDSTHLMNYLSALPWGLIDKDDETNEMIASANISPVILNPEDNFSFFVSNLTRFATKKWKENFASEFAENKKILENQSFHPTYTDYEESFPIWETNSGNELIQIAQKAYKNINIEPKLKKEKVALETAYFAEKNPNLKMVSIGAIVKNEHNVNESMDLDSYYDLASVILYILRNC